jgi:hypothetical protein
MGWQNHFVEAIMCIIYESVEVAKKREFVFAIIKTSNFSKIIDQNATQNLSIQIENDRILRTTTCLENIGPIETEKIFLPEVYTIISQRRDNLSPFKYQIIIQVLEEINDVTIIKWIIDFEMNEKMLEKESYFASIIKSHAQNNLRRISEYFALH